MAGRASDDLLVSADRRCSDEMRALRWGVDASLLAMLGIVATLAVEL